MVGKYVELHDAYLSIVESLHHGGIATGADVEINWINAEYLTEQNISKYVVKMSWNIEYLVVLEIED